MHSLSGLLHAVNWPMHIKARNERNRIESNSLHQTAFLNAPQSERISPTSMREMIAYTHVHMHHTEA